MLNKRYLLAGLLALAIAPRAQATVFLTYDITPLAGGAIAYDLYFNDDSGIDGTWFAQNWTFEGDIQQKLAFGINTVSKEVDADTFDALQNVGSGYKKLEDTWVGAAFTTFPLDTVHIPPPPNPLDQPGLFGVTAGTDPSNKLSTTLFVHLVANGPITYSGNIARSGSSQFLPFSGVLAVPEPSSIALATLGGLAIATVAIRRRKPARR